ncbi:MAG: hypothetical protein WA908_10695 [Pontixanthobacter sp.]
MWDICLSSFEKGVSAESKAALTPAEGRLAARTIRYGLPTSALMSEHRHLRNFRQLRSRSQAGAQICYAIATALLDRLRRSLSNRDWHDARKVGGALLHVGGLRFPLQFWRQRHNRRAAEMRDRELPAHHCVTEYERDVIDRIADYP